MTNGGLNQAEALEQVRWLGRRGMVDRSNCLVDLPNRTRKDGSWVDFSRCSAVQAHRCAGSITEKSLGIAPVKKESTRIRESFFADFSEKVQA